MIVFGQVTSSPAPLTALEQVQVPAYISTLQVMKEAEDALYKAYASIYSYRQAGGDAITIPTNLLHSYNTARENLIQAATKWTDVRSKIPREDLPDPDATIKYPPAFLLDTSNGVSGFGAALPASVPASRVMVAYDGMAMPLGSAQAPLQAWQLAQLGQPVTFVIIILGLTLGGLVIAYVIREWNKAEVEQNRTLALQTKEQTKQVEEVSARLVELQTNCIRGSTDPDVRVSCTKATQKAMADAIGALPRPPTVSGTRVSKVLMLIAVAAGVSAAGYAIWRKRQQRATQAAAERESQAEEAAAEPEEVVTLPKARVLKKHGRGI